MILCMKLLRACVLAVLSPLILAIYGIVILHFPFFHNVHDSLGFHPFSSHTFAGYFSPYAPSDPHLTPLRRHHACRRGGGELEAGLGSTRSLQPKDQRELKLINGKY